MKTQTDNYYDVRKKATMAFLQDYLLRLSLEKAAEEVDKAEMADMRVAEDAAEEARLRASIPMAKARRPDLEELLPGQIRLLSQPQDSIWVLLLQSWGGDSWLVVPFSPHPFPATEEEFFLGGQRTEYLDVLQMWNTRSLSALFLRRSWLVDTLQPEELERAQLMFSYTFDDEQSAGELLANTGLPIVSAEDPRLDYKDESLQRFASLDAADMLWSDLSAKAVEGLLGALPGEEREVATAAKGWLKLPTLQDIFAPLPLAAAGQSDTSLCWQSSLPTTELLAKLLHAKSKSLDLELQESTATWDKIGSASALLVDTTLLWTHANKQLQDDSGYDALFFHRQNRQLLGTGYVAADQQEQLIVMSDWLVEKSYKIKSVADITIMLTRPEKCANE